jgi:hypothetical protein
VAWQARQYRADALRDVTVQPGNREGVWQRFARDHVRQNWQTGALLRRRPSCGALVKQLGEQS